MKIIGAGLFRTGTLSMQAALQTLRYPCHHMSETSKVEGHMEAWYGLVSGQAPMDWQAIFGSLVIPGVRNYTILLAKRAYPDRSSWILWKKGVTFRMP